MNLRDFAVVIVRFFGLWLLFQCIYMVEGTISAFLTPFSNTSPEYNRFIAVISIFNLFLNAVLGVVLTWKPQLAADRLPPEKARETHIKPTTASLILLGFAVAGVVFVVSGLRGLVYQMVVWWSTPSGPMFQASVEPAKVRIRGQPLT